MARYELAVEAEFSAAHQIPGHPGRCARVHGHNYRVLARFAGRGLDDMGMVADFGDLKSLLTEALAPLDHSNLNELSMFEGAAPTSERIAQVIHRELARMLDKGGHPKGGDLRVTSVTVWESARSSVTYREDDA
jgi:6-pyruvoyltetrahydropterin/6-carboxytetrahydropterin synthase